MKQTFGKIAFALLTAYISRSLFTKDKDLNLKVDSNKIESTKLLKNPWFWVGVDILLIAVDSIRKRK